MEDVPESDISILYELYALDTVPNRFPDCGIDGCTNAVCWLVIWTEGACDHMPREICSLGRILIEDVMEQFGNFECTVCGGEVVPAAIVPIPYHDHELIRD